MNYRLIQFGQSKLLNQIIFDLYRITTGKEESSYYTAPNGIIGLSITLSGHSFIYSNNAWNKLPAAHVYGLIQKPQLLRVSKNFTEIAIGFKPYFLQLLLKEKMQAVAHTSGVDAYELFQKWALDRLQEALILAQTEQEIILAVEHFVQEHLQAEKADKRLFIATELITQNKISKVEELSDMLNISSTTLRSLFREKVGLTPKEMIGLNRIRMALTQTHTENLTALAYAVGYFDQSHFIHDFRSRFGITPMEYFSNEKLTFDFYNYGRWQGDNFGMK